MDSFTTICSVRERRGAKRIMRDFNRPNREKEDADLRGIQFDFGKFSDDW